MPMPVTPGPAFQKLGCSALGRAGVARATRIYRRASRGQAPVEGKEMTSISPEALRSCNRKTGE
jgi:hypothetical protein